jgi:hypothetical protein
VAIRAASLAGGDEIARSLTRFIKDLAKEGKPALFTPTRLLL